MKNNNYLKILNLLLFITLVITFVCSLYATDKVALAGSNLGDIESKIDDQKRYNYYLTTELNKLNSTAALYDRIQKAQFVKATIDYMDVPEYAYR